MIALEDRDAALVSALCELSRCAQAAEPLATHPESVLAAADRAIDLWHRIRQIAMAEVEDQSLDGVHVESCPVCGDTPRPRQTRRGRWTCACPVHAGTQPTGRGCDAREAAEDWSEQVREAAWMAAHERRAGGGR